MKLRNKDLGSINSALSERSENMTVLIIHVNMHPQKDPYVSAHIYISNRLYSLFIGPLLW